MNGRVGEGFTRRVWQLWQQEATDALPASEPAHELVLLERGRLVRAGSVDEVFGSGDVAKVFAVELEYEPRTSERPPRLSLSGRTA